MTRRTADSDSTPPPAWLEIVALAALTAVGMLLRAHRLGEWPLDGDEIETIHEADAFDRYDLPLASRSTLFSGPLLHWGYRQLIGPLADPVLAVRALPLLFGVLAVPALYAAVRPLYGAWAALCAALLLATSPLHIHLSGYGRYYAPVFLLTGAAGLSLLHLVRGRRWSGGLIGGACLLLSCGFHASTLFVGVPLLLLGALSPGPRAGWRWGGAAVLAVLAATIPALWLGPAAVTETARGMIESARSRTSSFGGLRLIASLVHDLGLAVPTLAGIGALLLFRPRRPERWTALLGIGLPLALVAVAGGFFHVGTRYLYGIVPLVLTLAGVALGRMLEALPRRPLAALALLGLALIPSAPVLLSNLADNARYPVPSMIPALLAERSPGEPVFAESHALTEYYSGVRCTELPPTAEGLGEQLEGHARAFVLLFFQHGVAVGTQDPGLQRFVEGNMRLLDQAAARRFDLHSYETRLYLWEAAEVSGEG